jgi:hypothetical protein
MFSYKNVKYGTVHQPCCWIDIIPVKGIHDGEGTNIYFQEELCYIGKVSKAVNSVYWAGCWCTGWKECVVKLHSSVSRWLLAELLAVSVLSTSLSVAGRVSWTFCLVRCCSCLSYICTLM